MIKENSFSHEWVIVKGLVSPPSKNKNPGALKTTQQNNTTNNKQVHRKVCIFCLSLGQINKKSKGGGLIEPESS